MFRAMIQIAYVSSTRGLLSADQLVRLLTKSRENNAEAGITGMLLYKDGNVLQILEGSAETVRALFDRIRRDQRHTGVIKLYQKAITERDFPEWLMGFRDLNAEATTELPGFSGILDPQFDMLKLNSSDAAKLLSSFKSSVR